jgi:DNA ligase (NAD+)
MILLFFWHLFLRIGMTTIVTAANAQTVDLDSLAAFYSKCKTAYYNTGTPLVDDDAFDRLETTLRQRAPDHAALAVVGTPKSASDKIRLPYWMGSQDKIYPDDKTSLFAKWKKRVGSSSATGAVATAKLDGLSAILVVTKAKTQLLSRGDGQNAKDWTHHLAHMESMRKPLAKIRRMLAASNASSSPRRVVLRGEAIMSRAHFEAHKAREQWTASARNVVSGLLNANHSDPALVRLVDVVFYEVIEPTALPFSAQLDWLEKRACLNVGHSLGETSNAVGLAGDFALTELEPLFWAWRQTCPYATDGVVVQPDAGEVVYARNTTGNPTHAFAFKIRVDDASQTAETTVTDVVWNISRHGYLKPTIVVEPVTIANITITKTTGFNYRFIRDNGVGEGSRVLVRRCGDVIPNVVAVLTQVAPLLPTVAYTLTDTGVDATASHPEVCAEYVVGQLAHFFEVMGVPHMGDKKLARFVANGYTDVFDILGVDASTLQTWDGFAHKSSVQLVADMRRAAARATARDWIHAGAVFGRGIGKQHLVVLLRSAPQLFRPAATKAAGAEKTTGSVADTALLRAHLLALPGYQAKTVDLLLANRRAFVAYWEKVGAFMALVKGKRPSLSAAAETTATTDTTDTTDAPPPMMDLQGRVFCFTGVHHKPLQKQLEARGARIAQTLTKKVDTLVCAALDGSSEKLVKAKALRTSGHGIQLLTIDEFLKTLEQPPTKRRIPQKTPA